jgi:hypothetical protein
MDVAETLEHNCFKLLFVLCEGSIVKTEKWCTRKIGPVMGTSFLVQDSTVKKRTALLVINNADY